MRSPAAPSKRAIAYLRVSTEQQADSGLGLEAQQASVNAAAARMKLQLAQTFVDAGTSGSLAIEDRPVLLDAVAALKRGDVLLVAKRDRLGRDVIAVAMIERLVTKRGAVLGTTGLRAGEMRALEWTDLDLKARKLFVARSEWQGQIGTTKVNKMRPVPMRPRLAEALRRHRHLQSARVLCTAGGEPLRANTLAYWIERATRAAGLATTRKPKGAGPDVLRHIFCSHLAMCGASAKAIQELAGHRDWRRRNATCT